MEFGTLVAATNRTLAPVQNLTPLRKVPKSNWPQSVSGGSISKAPSYFLVTTVGNGNPLQRPC